MSGLLLWAFLVVEAWYPEAEPRLLPKPLEGFK